MTSTGYIAQFFGERILSIIPGYTTTIYSYGAHNLVNGTPVLIQYAKGITSLNGNVYPLTVLGSDSFSLPVMTSGTYTGEGTYSIASMANHFLSEEI